MRGCGVPRREPRVVVAGRLRRVLVAVTRRQI